MDKFTTERKIEVLNSIWFSLGKHETFAPPHNSNRELYCEFICHCFEYHTGIKYRETFDYLPELWNNRPDWVCDEWDEWDLGIEEKKEIINKTIKQLESLCVLPT